MIKNAINAPQRRFRNKSFMDFLQNGPGVSPSKVNIIQGLIAKIKLLSDHPQKNNSQILKNKNLFHKKLP
ncbi:MAG: hypothetical protein CM1200mP16_12500 [Nitrospina sp.]|nr:MAG: hypothetical protein CM1200mP16_12500 [Nitrospina sp.]